MYFGNFYFIKNFSTDNNFDGKFLERDLKLFFNWKYFLQHQSIKTRIFRVFPYFESLRR